MLGFRSVSLPSMADERPTLILVDASGYIFRAFHALPPLTNSRGMPTNAIFGFTRMLVKLLKEARPTHIAMVFDTPKKTFRDHLFESYKANRVAPPNDLIVQIPYVHRVVESFRIRSIMVDGYEADDVIGTLAARASKQKFVVVVVTGDKDFMQIVSPSVTLWDTMFNKRTSAKEVRERFGVEPRAMIDIQALMGDSIDNIKGVPGVGAKTASALIKRFGSVDGLFKNLEKLEETEIRGASKLAGVIAENREAVMLARKLVAFDNNVPIDLDIESLRYDGVDEKAAATLMSELEFGSLRAELAPSETVRPRSSRASEKLVAKEDLASVLARLRSAQRISVYFDSEGGLLKLSADEKAEVFCLESSLIAEAREVIESAEVNKSCHDLKSLLGVMRKREIEPRGFDFDTMLAGFLINPGRVEPKIEDLYREHLAPLGGRAPDGSEPVTIAQLRPVLIKRMEADEIAALYRTIELPLASVLAEMERAGIRVDVAALRAMSDEFAQQLELLERECFELAGKSFNLNSPNQLRELLFEDLKLPTKGLKKTKNGFSTDVDALTKLAEDHPLPRKLLEYRAISKLKSTYVDSIPELIGADGRIHTSFHQALTATGRLSSSEPNLQNIPTRTTEGRRIRRAFVARKGCVLLAADYSQIELRVLAHLSGDKTLTQAFKRGEDIHIRTATEVLGIKPESVDAEARRLAKVINFGIIYGMGPQRLSGELGIPLKEASEYIKRYFERLEGVSDYMERCLKEGRERGFVTTMFGRRRYLPELNSPQGGARAQAERIAINTPIQGTAADLIKIAMVRLDPVLREFGSQARMLLQVHDELLFEVESNLQDEVSRHARSLMEGVATLNVPLRIELKRGPNWAQLAAF
jgi:DNA polymerase-1